jgi:hypothetical protein
MKLRRQWPCLHAWQIDPWLGLSASERQISRLFSSRRSSHATYRFLDVLPDASLEEFRAKSFRPEVPAILPRGHFRSLPAVSTWFSPRKSGASSVLNYDYLTKYVDTVVPLELTRNTDEVIGDRPHGGGKSFQRFHAPLSLFLDWTRKGQEHPLRLYLAQCQLNDLPSGLRDDLPTPEIVSKTGKGDIYDTNIWIGMPPTYTPLHRDPNPNLFVQLAGSKQVRILPPEAGLRVFARVRMDLGRSAGPDAAAFRTEEMMIGREKTLLEDIIWSNEQSSPPIASEMTGFEAFLEAGDAVFIPKGWWHSIKGVGEGITASVCSLCSQRDSHKQYVPRLTFLQVNWWFR